jgi:hypothetical protein
MSKFMFEMRGAKLAIRPYMASCHKHIYIWLKLFDEQPAANKIWIELNY